jgi:hypothetical protein
LKPDIQVVPLESAIEIATWANGFTNYRGTSGNMISSHEDEDEDDGPGLDGWQSVSQAKARVGGEINKMIVNTIFGRIRDIILKDIERFAPKVDELILASPAISNHRNLQRSKDVDEPFFEDTTDRLSKAIGPGILSAFPPVKTACQLLVYVTDLTFDHDSDKVSSI